MGTEQMRCVCELDSLKNASPATVSRNGLLYINEGDVGWRPAADVWLNSREDKNELNFLPALFDKYIDSCQFMSKSNNLTEITPVRVLTKSNAVTAIVARLLEKMSAAQKTQEALEQIFLFATIWAFGGCMCDDRTNDNRTKFDEAFQQTYKDALAVSYPKDSSIFEYFYDPTTNEWEPFSDQVKKYEYQPIGWNPGETDFSSIFVEYSDAVKNSYILKLLVEHEQACILVGLAGTGKTVLMDQYLDTADPDVLQTC